MSTLSFSRLRMPMAEMNGESSLPSIAAMINVQHKTETVLDEDDELYIGYGFRNNVFPYRQQDMYGRELYEKDADVAVLENENLKAVFVPSLGGRLWSLYDKVNNKELLFANPVFRPGNLALRNAWFSGGVEWNIGMVGHSPFTCSQVFAARLEAYDSTPVLRLYEYERIRKVTYQIDFFLPRDSKLLYCRMRIVNPGTETIPMYWWSNIAVPEIPHGRIVMSADETYSNKGGIISKTTVPVSNGIDITYPVSNAHAIDFFWKVNPGNRKYVCQINGDGYGLIQASTRRLKGRKLFVWGQGPGGERWQEFLSKDGTGGKYVEIQAGLAHTQYECLPMPPKTAWEWMEVYGAIQTDPDKIHGDWQEAKAEVENKLDCLIASDELENLLAETKETIALKPAREIIFRGSGWGALENKRREISGEEPLSRHLDFGDIDSAQEQWGHLMYNGVLKDMHPESVPESWMDQAEFTLMLENAVNGADEFNWYTWMHLGMVYLNNNKLDYAKKALNRSMELTQNCWAVYGLAILAKNQNENEKAAGLALRASLMKPDDASLAKEALNLLCSAKLYKEALNLISKLSDSIQKLGRVQLYKAHSLAYTGNLADAEKIIYKDDGIVVPDIREGEISISDLWFAIEEKKAQAQGKVFDRENAFPPAFLDFRMNAVRRK